MGLYLLQGAENLVRRSLVYRSLFLTIGCPRGKWARAGWRLSDVKNPRSSIFPFHLVSLISGAVTSFFLFFSSY